MIKIVLDSTADTPDDLRDTYGFTIVPLMVQFGAEAFRDGVEISHDEFYRRLVEDTQFPRTAAPSVGAFEQVFRTLSADGSDIISISLAGSLSATLSAAQQAARLVEGARIVCIDSRTAAMPITYMAIAAAEAAREGRSFEDVVALVESLRSRAVVFVGLDTLRYLEKGGRIGRMRAFLGTMLSVKLMLEFRDGEILPVEQVRTWKRVPPRMVELMRARGALEDISVLYTTDRDGAERMADLCAESGLLPRERIRVGQTGAVIGAHVGPGAVGLTGMVRAER